MTSEIELLMTRSNTRSGRRRHDLASRIFHVRSVGPGFIGLILPRACAPIKRWVNTRAEL